MRELRRKKERVPYVNNALKEELRRHQEVIDLKDSHFASVVTLALYLVNHANWSKDNLGLRIGSNSVGLDENADLWIVARDDLDFPTLPKTLNLERTPYEISRRATQAAEQYTYAGGIGIPTPRVPALLSVYPGAALGMYFKALPGSRFFHPNTPTPIIDARVQCQCCVECGVPRRDNDEDHLQECFARTREIRSRMEKDYIYVPDHDLPVPPRLDAAGILRSHDPLYIVAATGTRFLYTKTPANIHFARAHFGLCLECGCDHIVSDADHFACRLETDNEREQLEESIKRFEEETRD